MDNQKNRIQDNLFRSPELSELRSRVQPLNIQIRTSEYPHKRGLQQQLCLLNVSFVVK